MSGTTVAYVSPGNATAEPGHYTLPVDRVPCVGEYVILPERGGRYVVVSVTWDYAATAVGVHVVVGLGT